MHMCKELSLLGPDIRETKENGSAIVLVAKSATKPLLLW